MFFIIEVQWDKLSSYSQVALTIRPKQLARQTVENTLRASLPQGP